ncbi:hypothetical protein C0992_002911, partial [Termitomyces sp. T32_za158]
MADPPTPRIDLSGIGVRVTKSEAPGEIWMVAPESRKNGWLLKGMMALDKASSFRLSDQ